MSSKKSKGKRMKGTTIDDQNDGTPLLPGRRECWCEASKHQLVANCLNCGRIVCAQEGVGDCFTCGHTVITGDQRRLLSQQKANNELSLNGIIEDVLSGNKSNNTGLKDIAASFEAKKSLDKAIGHKDQMLEFDRNSSVRTKVIDDQNDYFSLGSQNWISNEKRKTISTKVEELHENKLKKNQKILIDLVEKSAKDYSEPVIKDFNKEIQDLNDESKLKSDYENVDANTFIDNNSANLPLLMYISSSGKKRKDRLIEGNNTADKGVIKSMINLRVQDKELMTMSDEGMCLSVNQPFASLLVCGIKRFEGRNWYSSFRGRLWIHSNSKTLDTQKVKEVEEFYSFAGIKTFPHSYPTSSLVGCVNVTDCLSFEEYRAEYPEGDTEANYILVCEDATQLSKPLPIASGGHRIYKLNQNIHFSALKSLEI